MYSSRELRQYVETSGVFGEPLEWEGLYLHPILMRDKEKFDVNISVFNIDKNSMGSIEFIQMSYLTFLLGLIEIDGSVKEAFIWLMEKILGIHYDEDLLQDGFEPNQVLVKDDEDGTRHYLINGWEIAFERKGQLATVFIGSHKLNATEFDEFRRIVLYQNIDGYDDTPISEDVKRVREQYFALKNKGIKQPTLEDKIMAVMVGSGETRESIKDMPCRQFDKLFSMVIDKTEYEAKVPLSPHLKDPSSIEHWVYKKEKDIWGEIFSSTDDIMKPNVK